MAALVSPLLRSLRSETHSETVDTISRAAIRGDAVLLFFAALAAAASLRFTILIFFLCIIVFVALITSNRKASHFAKNQKDFCDLQTIGLRIYREGCSKNYVTVQILSKYSGFPRKPRRRHNYCHIVRL